MTSQVVVNIDSKLKTIAMEMAKKEGLTMKALLSFLLKGYIEKEIVLGAKLSNNSISEFEFEEWSEEELNILKNSKELKKLEKEFNSLIIKKGI